MSNNSGSAIPENWKRREFPGIPASLEALWVQKGDGGYHYGVQLDERHHNAQGYVHGGVLTSFADHAMSLVVWEASERANCSTVQMNSSFLSALKAPAFVQIDTTITKKGRQMIFAHAILRVGDDPVMEVSGVWRVFTKR